MKNAKDDQSVEDKKRAAEEAAEERREASSAERDQASAEQSGGDRDPGPAEKTHGSGRSEDDSPEGPGLEEQLAEARAQAQENYNSYLRAVADLDTYRRRVAREKEELKQYAIGGLLEDLLPVYDNLSLGLSSAEQTTDPKVVVQGLQMVLSQMRNLLEERGVVEIAPKKGEAFDPNQAEAFQTQPSDEVPEGRVLSLMRKGFSLNGRLVRPASVIVSGGPKEEGSSE